MRAEISEREKRSKIESQRRIAAARTPEQRAEFNAYHRAWKKKKRDRMTAEEKADHAKKESAKKAEWLAGLSDERKTARRIRMAKWMAKKRASDREGDRRKKRAWVRKKKKECPEFRIENALRGRLVKAARRYGMREMKPATMLLVGCTRAELRAHLEKQFKSWMTWENYGYRGWHIDHIRPVSSFNLLNPDEMRACFHFTNLQPLWGILNMKKGNRFEAFAN